MILHCIRQLALTALVGIIAASGVASPNELLPVQTERVAETASGGTPSELRGTSWQWVGFTSSAESLTVANPERYTLTFTDDRVAIRADCNRGTTPVASPSPGALRIGPIAMTRALCPPGSLSNRFARDLSRTVHYSIRGGELHLELPSDSGVLRFRRGS